MSLATPASAPAGDCANDFFFQLEQRNGSSEAASRLLGFEQGRWGRLGGLAAALATETAAASSCASVDAQQDPQSEAAVTDPCCTFALLRRLFFFLFPVPSDGTEAGRSGRGFHRAGLGEKPLAGSGTAMPQEKVVVLVPKYSWVAPAPVCTVAPNHANGTTRRFATAA